MSFLKCICISVDSAHGSLQATARDKLVTVTLCVFVSVEFACVCVCFLSLKLLIGCWWSSLHRVSGEVWTDNSRGGEEEGRRWWWCEWREWTMEGWRLSEEWGQAPEVQSHQLRQLCGANTGARRRWWWWGWWWWGGVEDEFAKEREGVRREMWWLHFYY